MFTNPCLARVVGYVTAKSISFGDNIANLKTKHLSLRMQFNIHSSNYKINKQCVHVDIKLGTRATSFTLI